jgi:hypothetical protein
VNTHSTCGFGHDANSSVHTKVLIVHTHFAFQMQVALLRLSATSGFLGVLGILLAPTKWAFILARVIPGLFRYTTESHFFFLLDVTSMHPQLKQ